MASPIIDIFKIPDIRKKVLFTLGVLVIFRVGAYIPIPGIDVSALQNARQSTGGFSLTEYFDFFSGGAFSQYSIFMLGIMPYISMSIIMQLLLLAFPALKKISEDDGGRNKIKRYTRYGTLVVCLIQAYPLLNLAGNPRAFISSSLALWQFAIIAVVTVTTGTLLLMWMGEQVTVRGIGNGTSLIIFAGIVAQLPGAVKTLFDMMPTEINPVFGLIAFVMYVGVVILVIYEQQALRKIPVHYAKRIVGKKMYQGQSTYIPFKINPSGVIPVIFAQALISFLLALVGPAANRFEWLRPFAVAISYGSWLYSLIYVLLIVFFAYFYTQVSMNPIEIARQIRENGGAIPGVRSEHMEEYLMKILNRIVLPGALFLAFIALVPSIMVSLFGFPQQVAYLMGGTSLLIMVGVDLDTMAQIEGQLKMHNHQGLVKGGRLRSRNL